MTEGESKYGVSVQQTECKYGHSLHGLKSDLNMKRKRNGRWLLLHATCIKYM